MGILESAELTTSLRGLSCAEAVSRGSELFGLFKLDVVLLIISRRAWYILL